MGREGGRHVSSWQTNGVFLPDADYSEAGVDALVQALDQHVASLVSHRLRTLHLRFFGNLRRLESTGGEPSNVRESAPAQTDVAVKEKANNS